MASVLAKCVELGPAKHADGAEQVEELPIVEPRTSPNRLVAQHRDLDGWAAERDVPSLSIIGSGPIPDYWQQLDDIDPD